MFLLMKINLNAIIFTICSFVFHRFIGFECFSLYLGGFLMFWKNLEIQDSKSKMVVVLTSSCNCHGI